MSLLRQQEFVVWTRRRLAKLLHGVADVVDPSHRGVWLHHRHVVELQRESEAFDRDYPPRPRVIPVHNRNGRANVTTHSKHNAKETPQ